jgi:hypothetical protein
LSALEAGALDAAAERLGDLLADLRQRTSAGHRDRRISSWLTRPTDAVAQRLEDVAALHDGADEDAVDGAAVEAR